MDELLLRTDDEKCLAQIKRSLENKGLTDGRSFGMWFALHLWNNTFVEADYINYDLRRKKSESVLNEIKNHFFLPQTLFNMRNTNEVANAGKTIYGSIQDKKTRTTGNAPKQGKYAIEGIGHQPTFDSAKLALQYCLKKRNMEGIMFALPIFETTAISKDSRISTMYINELKEIIEYCFSENEECYEYFEPTDTLKSSSFGNRHSCSEFLKVAMREANVPPNFIKINPDPFIKNTKRKGVLITDNVLLEGYELNAVIPLMPINFFGGYAILLNFIYRAVSCPISINMDPDKSSSTPGKFSSYSVQNDTFWAPY